MPPTVQRTVFQNNPRKPIPDRLTILDFTASKDDGGDGSENWNSETLKHMQVTYLKLFKLPAGPSKNNHLGIAGARFFLQAGTLPGIHPTVSMH